MIESTYHEQDRNDELEGASGQLVRHPDLRGPRLSAHKDVTHVGDLLKIVASIFSHDFKKIGHSRPLFLHFSSFSMKLTVKINFDDD